MNDYKNILEIIRTTRAITLPGWGHVDVLKQKDEFAGSVVTEIDEQVERHLAAEFAKEMPEVAYVGEEFGGDRSAERFWLVDPIDGTGHYVRGLPYCTTMVALIENGSVTLGVIYDFVHDVLYHAVRGKGAYANGVRIHVNARDISQAYVCYETKLDTPENVEKFMQLRKVCTTLSHVCAGYEHILVATGKVEGRIGYNPYGTDYDFAPGSLLIAEAGGIVTNVGSETYDFTNPNYIATNPSVHASLTTGSNALFPIIQTRQETIL